MKTIKNSKDIQIRKMQLRIRQLEQEKNLSNSWKELGNNFNPEILKEQFKPELKSNETLKGLLISNGLNFGAGILSRKLTEFAGQKIETAMQRGVRKIARKLNKGIQKKS